MVTYESPPTRRTKCEVWSRVVGYLRPVENWNEGKLSEFKDRKLFKLLEKSKEQLNNGEKIK